MYKEICVLFQKPIKAPTGDLKLPLDSWRIKTRRYKKAPRMEIPDAEVPDAKEINTIITEADKTANNSLF